MPDTFPMSKPQTIAPCEGYLRHDPDNPALFIVLARPRAPLRRRTSFAIISA
jgi:hypothetical protein